MDEMNEEDFEQLLLEVFGELSDNDNFRDELENNRTRTFEDAGLLTMDKGVVVTLHNGKQFQLTIKQSR